VVEWSVGSSAVTGLSVSNSSFNVLVCSRDSPTVRIYTPLGCPVCAISLQLSEPHGSLVGLVHALECSNSLFVIGVKQSGDRLACVYRNDASYLQGYRRDVYFVFTHDSVMLERVLAIVILSVRLFVCLSVTSRYCIKCRRNRNFGFHRIIAYNRLIDRGFLSNEDVRKVSFPWNRYLTAIKSFSGCRYM